MGQVEEAWHIGLVMVNYKVNVADGSIQRLGLDQRWTIKFGLGWIKRQSQKPKSSVLERCLDWSQKKK